MLTADPDAPFGLLEFLPCQEGKMPKKCFRLFFCVVGWLVCFEGVFVVFWFFLFMFFFSFLVSLTAALLL